MEKDELPATTLSAPDASGVVTRTSWRWNASGKKEKIVEKVQRTTRRYRVITKRENRLMWEPFGMAKDKTDNVTKRSVDDIAIEYPGHHEAEEEKDEDEELPGNKGVVVCNKCKAVGKHWSLACPYKHADDPVAAREEAEGMASEEAPTWNGGIQPPHADGSSSNPFSALSGSTTGGAYRPPGSSGAGASMAMRETEELTTCLRVSNVSRRATEDDIRDLFGDLKRFGRVQSVRMPLDHKGSTRGLAFVTYYDRRAAETAKDTLNGYGYDHLILKVEWAKPSVRKDGGGPGGLSGGFVSGYGKALPQMAR